jgi:hypothetical protein
MVTISGADSWEFEDEGKSRNKGDVSPQCPLDSKLPLVQ